MHPSSAIQADVQDEWEDDTAGMRYGDWENDEDEGQIGQAYRRPKAAPVPRTSHPLVTRNLRDAQALPPHLPSPQAPPQEVRRSSHRLTQPLTPQAIARMNQQLPQEASLAQPMPMRQMLVSEPSALQAPTNMPAISPGNCPICKGAGYLRVDVPYGHPNFGKPIPCECKEAGRKEKRRRQLREMSNLDAFRDKSFKNFNPRVPGVQEAYQVALEYAQNPQGWLIFIGKNGCGKTHLAAAIANQHLARGSLVLFAVVPELLDHLRATFAPNSTVVYDQLFSTMREAELLILDDLGSEQNSPWACEKLFQLLNYRYNSRFPTVITTNNIRLQAVDERIRSRLMDKSLVTEITFNHAQDYRPLNPRRD
jgi:DNA replication protein DnaC